MEVLYVSVAALASALAVVAVYHLAVVRPAQARLAAMLDLHDGLIAGGSGSAAGRLTGLEAGHESASAALERLRERADRLERLAESDLSRTGFVRFDAFADSESGLSYALALLNRCGDGVVLSSLYSRTDTRTFGKAVEGFVPVAHASNEELEAIEKARAAGAGEVAS